MDKKLIEMTEDELDDYIKTFVKDRGLWGSDAGQVVHKIMVHFMHEFAKELKENIAG